MFKVDMCLLSVIIRYLCTSQQRYNSFFVSVTTISFSFTTHPSFQQQRRWRFRVRIKTSSTTDDAPWKFRSLFSCVALRRSWVSSSSRRIDSREDSQFPISLVRRKMFEYVHVQLVQKAPLRIVLVFCCCFLSYFVLRREAVRVEESRSFIRLRRISVRIALHDIFTRISVVFVVIFNNQSETCPVVISKNLHTACRVFATKLFIRESDDLVNLSAFRTRRI